MEKGEFEFVQFALVVVPLVPAVVPLELRVLVAVRALDHFDSA